MAEAIVDADVVDDDIGPTAPSVPSTQIARRERRSEVMRPLAVDELVESFEAYQEMLPRLLQQSDYQDAGKDRDGKPKRFVKKSGWRKIATAFDLDVIIVRDEVERDMAGQAVRARVVARAIAPSGRMMDGDGYCSIEEFSGRRSDSDRIENDLRGTATTRAKNRAISDLVGMGEVSAEEVEAQAPAAAVAGPEFGPLAESSLRTAASQAATAICGTPEAARAWWVDIQARCGGHMPHVVAQTIVEAAGRTVASPPDPGEIDADGQPKVDPVKLLQDEAFSLWFELDPNVAGDKVRQAGDNIKALKALISAAKKGLRAKQESKAVAA